MIVIDIETTGIIPWKNSIIDIGAVDFYNPNNRFDGQCLIWEGADIRQSSLDINGYDIMQITPNNKESFRLSHNQLIKDFLQWTEHIEERTPCSQNPRFDISFLIEAAKIANFEWTLSYRSIDLHTTAFNSFLQLNKEIPIKEKTKTSRLSLDKILDYLNLPTESKPHKAINGAVLVAEAYSRLIYKKNIIPEFSSFKL